MTPNGCFLHDHGVMEDGSRPGPCDGRLVQAHLVRKTRLAVEAKLPLEQVTHDARTWVWACGGQFHGNAGHHGQFDQGTLVLPRAVLPGRFFDFLAEHKILWILERYFG